MRGKLPAFDRYAACTKAALRSNKLWHMPYGNRAILGVDAGMHGVDRLYLSAECLHSAYLNKSMDVRDASIYMYHKCNIMPTV
jgi:hypothetical protein